MTFLNRILTQSFRKKSLVLALGIFLLPVLPACQEEAELGEGAGIGEETELIEPDVTEGDVDEPLTVAQQVEENVELEDLTGDISDYIGRSVSVRSDVTNAVGESAFLLQDDSWFGAEEVLAINATGEPFELPLDTELQVTGEVTQFVLVDLERDYGIELDPEIYADYEQQPVIVAESVALSPDPGEVTDNPTQYYNEVIAVEGEIGEFVSPGIFRMENEALFGGEGLIVLSNVGDLAQAALDSGELGEDDQIVVTGTLRPFVRAEYEAGYDFWDANVLESLEAEYERQPVLVAREVYASAEE